MKKILLASVAALSVLSASAVHATVKLPDTITGDWCILEGDNERMVFYRAPKDRDTCLYHIVVAIDQEGVDDGTSTGRCTFERIEQTRPNAFMVYTRCPVVNTLRPNTWEIIDGKLVMSVIPES